MNASTDNALAALERARQAQEAYERRIDVQLRLDRHVFGVSFEKRTAGGHRERIDPLSVTVSKP